MNEKLIFADGSRLENAHAIKVNAVQLFLYIQTEGATFRNMFELLTDSGRTRTIRAELMDGTREEYAGYTELVSLRKETDGQITAILEKGE